MISAGRTSAIEAIATTRPASTGSPPRGCASPTCSPSRASVITGQHPARLRIVRQIPVNAANGFDKFGRTGKPWNILPADLAQFPSRNWLPLKVTTITEALKPLGYYSAFFGKWHSGSEPCHPVKQGFDEQHGVTNFGHPRHDYPPYFLPGTNPDAPAGEYLTDRLTGGVAGFLDQQTGRRPFLCLAAITTGR